VKGVNCEKMGGTIYTPYDVLLRRELPFGGHDDCICVKMFSGNHFLKL